MGSPFRFSTMFYLRFQPREFMKTLVEESRFINRNVWSEHKDCITNLCNRWIEILFGVLSLTWHFEDVFHSRITNTLQSLYRDNLVTLIQLQIERREPHCHSSFKGGTSATWRYLWSLFNQFNEPRSNVGFTARKKEQSGWLSLIFHWTVFKKISWRHSFLSW